MPTVPLFTTASNPSPPPPPYITPIDHPPPSSIMTTHFPRSHLLPGISRKLSRDFLLCVSSRSRPHDLLSISDHQRILLDSYSWSVYRTVVETDNEGTDDLMKDLSDVLGVDTTVVADHFSLFVKESIEGRSKRGREVTVADLGKAGKLRITVDSEGFDGCSAASVATQTDSAPIQRAFVETKYPPSCGVLIKSLVRGRRMQLEGDEGREGREYIGERKEAKRVVDLEERESVESVPSPRRGEKVVPVRTTDGGSVLIAYLNTLDSRPPPTNWLYQESPSSLPTPLPPTPSKPCHCRALFSCLEPKHCPCARLNQSESNYSYYSGSGPGKKLTVAGVSSAQIRECGAQCSCQKKECALSFLTQRYEMEANRAFFVVRTRDDVWMLNTQNFISKGEFVLEVTGELLPSSQVTDREDLFLVRLCDGWVLDTKEKGNLSRFVGHSCTPTLVVVRVRGEGHFPRILLFSSRSIPPGGPLTVNIAHLWLHGSDQHCHCGVPSCTDFIVR